MVGRMNQPGLRRLIQWITVTVACGGFLFGVSYAGAAAAAQGDVRIADRSEIKSQETGTTSFVFGGCPSERLAVLRLRIFITSPSPAGLNFNASLAIDGVPILAESSDGKARLLNKPPSFQLKGDPRVFNWFNGDRVAVLFAPSSQAAERMVEGGGGANWVLDVTDLLRKAGPHTLSIRNMRPGGEFRGEGGRVVQPGPLVVEEASVGCADAAGFSVTAPPPQRPADLGLKLVAGDYSIEVGKRGGLLVRVGEALYYLETGMSGLKDELWWKAVDAAASGSPEVHRVGTDGIVAKANWDGLTIEREIRAAPARVTITETWRNETSRLRGIPFVSRLFSKEGTVKPILGGNPDAAALPSTAANPTVFLGQPGGKGGLGWVAEDDRQRLMISVTREGYAAAIATRSLALPPGGSIRFVSTLHPQSAGDYWDFINRVRADWGVNRIRIDGPFYYFYRASDLAGLSDERLKVLTEGKGSGYIMLVPWIGLQPDAEAVRKSAPLEEVLAGKQLRAGVEALEKQIGRLRNIGGMKACALLHPSMVVVNRAALKRWAFFEDAIRGPDGNPFESSQYSADWLGERSRSGWGVLYFAPRPGSAFLAHLQKIASDMFTVARPDALYVDEFSFVGAQRNYSRYDYSRWDGYSADLDAKGDVLRKKDDVAVSAAAGLIELVRSVLARGAQMMANGAPATRELQTAGIVRWVESTGGFWSGASAHLSTPLELSLWSDTMTLRDVIAEMRRFLKTGVLYSPGRCLHLLSGADNVVARQFPITVQRVGAGTVIGKERIVTAVSGLWHWPEPGGRVRVLTYDENGKLLGPQVREVQAGTGLQLDVPAGGVVIAERMGDVP
jgi:hypothetical protein